jgi:hypothetical protein
MKRNLFKVSGKVPLSLSSSRARSLALSLSLSLALSVFSAAFGGAKQERQSNWQRTKAGEREAREPSRQRSENPDKPSFPPPPFAVPKPRTASTGAPCRMDDDGVWTKNTFLRLYSCPIVSYVLTKLGLPVSAHYQWRSDQLRN